MTRFGVAGFGDGAQVRLRFDGDDLGDRVGIVGEVEAVAGSDFDHSAGQAVQERCAVRCDAAFHQEAGAGVEAGEQGVPVVHRVLLVLGLPSNSGGYDIVKSVHNASDSRSTGTGGALKRLFELAVMTSELMERGMAERGLTRARASVLWALHQRGPATQRELADLIGVTPRNITGLLDGLEADGFAERGRHPTDRRATLVSLTAKGLETMIALTEEYQDGYKWLFEGISADNLAVFISVACTVMDRIRTIDC